MVTPCLPNGDWDYRPAVDRLIDGGSPPPESWGGPPRPLPPRPTPRHLQAPPRPTGRQHRADVRAIARTRRVRRVLALVTRRTAA